jgi:benzoyl-CoA reductase/2-hydroxyglutaryl-CoA dehydratase subunit BcrC/BadD/HgdB
MSIDVYKYTIYVRYQSINKSGETVTECYLRTNQQLYAQKILHVIIIIIIGEHNIDGVILQRYKMCQSYNLLSSTMKKSLHKPSPL